MQRRDLEKLIATVLLLVGIFANTLGLTTRLIFFQSTLVDLINTISTALSLIILVVLGIVFFAKRRYVDMIVAAIIVTADLCFPIILATNPTGIFIFYLSMMGTAMGLLTLKNWKLTFLGLPTLLLYLSIIYIKANNIFPNLFPMHNSWYRENYLQSFGGLISSFTFPWIAVTCTLSAFLGTNKALHKQARLDAVTGVSNRLSFDIDLHSTEINFAAILDIDHFKQINDTYGHQAGDRALKTLCDIISKHTSDNFRFYRYGGEEFFILSRENKEDFLKRLLTIWNDLKENFKLRETEHLSVSIGVAENIKNDSDLLVEFADIELYKAKQNGRCQVWLSDQKLKEFV